MSTQPLVCICIPNYNNELTLSITLDSILNQTYKNIILKVFDNASTDSSIDILNKYATKYKNIKIFRNPVNIGGEANFTKCFDNAEGKFTAVFHSDDVYESTMIEEQVKFLEKNTNCSAVATHASFINQNGVIVGEHFVPDEIKHMDSSTFNFLELFKLSLKYGNIITCPSVMIQTKIVQNKIKYWDFKKFKTSADFDVWLRLAKVSSLGFINEPLINYRISESSFSYTHNRLSTTMFDMFLVFEHYLRDPSIQKALSQEDLDNYNFQYTKASLSININNYLLSKYDYIKPKKINFKFEKKYILLIVLNILFNIVKYIKLPTKIKEFILDKKVNKKWFQL